MKKYKLCVASLPSNEASLVRSIIRLSSELGGRWETSDQAEDADAVAVDVDAKQDGTFANGGLPLMVSRNWREAQSGALLARPIRVDGLIAALGVLEGKLNIDSANSVIRRAKLMRWPVQHVSSGSSSNLRMATVLSRMSCTAGELAKRLSLPQDACERFMAALDQEGFLTWEAADQSVAEQLPAPSPVQSVTSPGKRLLGAIRQRLGFSWGSA